MAHKFNQRSASHVLRDMAKQEKEKEHVAESTSEAGEDRTSPSERSARSEPRPATPSASEETSAVTSEDTGRSAEEDKKEIAETTTKATAIVKPTSEPVREFSVCPRCHERRYKPEQVGTTVKCINCRASVVLR
jgi:hypothetical protein